MSQHYRRCASRISALAPTPKKHAPYWQNTREDLYEYDIVDSTQRKAIREIWQNYRHPLRGLFSAPSQKKCVKEECFSWKKISFWKNLKELWHWVIWGSRKSRVLCTGKLVYRNNYFFRFLTCMGKYRNWRERCDKVGLGLFFKSFVYKIKWFVQKFMGFFGDSIELDEDSSVP